MHSLKEASHKALHISINWCGVGSEELGAPMGEEVIGWGASADCNGASASGRVRASVEAKATSESKSTARTLDIAIAIC